jgi:hypothetical protein
VQLIVNFKVTNVGIYHRLRDLASPTCPQRYIVLRKWTLDVGLGHQLTLISLWYLGYSWYTVGDCSFPVAGPGIWNNLPETVHSAPSLKKAALKTALFSRYYI